MDGVIVRVDARSLALWLRSDVTVLQDEAALDGSDRARRIVVDGVDHVWAPSAAYIMPDRLQETIGHKEVGTMTLTLDDCCHRFDEVVSAGMRENNIEDFLGLYS